MQTSKAETRATVEMSDVMRDGYYLEQTRRASAYGVFKLRHRVNGNLLQIEWQNEPIPMVSVIKNDKVVNLIYV
jgi:hypothetical protein